MNKLVYSALALTLVSVPGLAADNEWSSLDQELNNLTSSLSAQNSSGPKVGGWVITSWRNSSDIDVPNTTGGTNHLGGFQFDSLRIEITGDAGQDYGYKVSFDFASGNTATLKDAYGTFKLGDAVSGKLGRYKQPFLRSALVSDNKTLFLERSNLGAIFSARDLGLQFSGSFDTVEWSLTAQNGSDDQGNKYRYTGRVTANLMGSGVGKNEGAYGSGGDDTNLMVGIAGSDDDELDKGLELGGEVNLTHGPFALSGEIVDFDKGTSVAGVDTFGINHSVIPGVLVDVANTTPWAATGSYMFTDMYEAAVRYEDTDDANNTTRWTIGVNRYVSGHDIKWTAEYSKVKSDALANDIDLWGFGLAVSF